MKALVLEENGKFVWREHELRVVEGWYRMRIAAAFTRILNREGFHCKTVLVN